MSFFFFFAHLISQKLREVCCVATATVRQCFHVSKPGYRTALLFPVKVHHCDTDKPLARLTTLVRRQFKHRHQDG